MMILPKQTPKPKRWIYAVLLLVVVVGCVIAVNFVNSKLQEQKTLADLEAVSKDLRVIYDKLLKANEGNVASSYYRNECFESSVKYGRGRITCGLRGNIKLMVSDKREDASQKLTSVTNNNAFDIISKSGSLTDLTSDLDMNIDLQHRFNRVGCYGIYAENSASNYVGYSVGCSKHVPDFLPGYYIEK